MKINKKWLNQYMDLSGMNIEEIADKIVSAGLGIEGTEKMSQGSNLVIGKMMNYENHPDSDHLHVCQVDLGDKAEQVVCGTSDVAAGQKVIVARVGAELLGGDIETGATRGQESNGMICSLLELSVDPHQLSEEGKDGVEVLDEDVPVRGEDPLGYLALDNEVPNMGLAPNRDDCMAAWSMILETSVILHEEVNIPYIEDASSIGEVSRLIIRSETKKYPFFLGKVINSVTTKPSSKWIQELLITTGMKSINSVVDISNIVILETGQPLHFYDLDAIPAQGITAKNQQRLNYTALDGGSYHIEEDDIAITTKGKPIGITGVMGGNGSKIEETMKGVIIETAIFHHVSIRDTSHRLNLGTDTSVCYQKDTEPVATFRAVDRVVQLLTEYADASGLEETKQYGSNGCAPLESDVNPDRINVLLGTDFRQEEVMKVLDGLHLEPSVNNSDIHVKIPSYRVDLAIKVDIAEEIVRILGYKRLPSTMPKMPSTVGALNRRQQLRGKYKNILSDLGYNEAVTYSLVGKKEIEDTVMPHKDIVELAAPMSGNHKYVRDSILSSLLECVAYNRACSIRDIALFEVSNIYGLGHVEERLAAAVSSALQENRWQKLRMEMGFYTTRGLVEAPLESIGYQENHVVFEENHTDIIHFHPHRSAEVYLGRELLGLVGQIHPRMTQAYDVTETLAPGINLEVLLKNRLGEMKFTEISRYPSISRNLAFVVKEDVKIVDIISSIKENGKLEKKNIIQSVEVFDVYTGEHVEKGSKSIALNIVSQSAQRTLRDADINEIHNRILETLEGDLHTQLRT